MMKIINFLFCFLLIICLASCYCLRNSLSGWACDLALTIQNVDPDTIYGQVDLIGTEILEPYNPNDPEASPEQKRGGLYRFTFDYSFNPPRCDSIGSRLISVETTRIEANLYSSHCFKLVGAFNKKGNFIAREIVDLTTNPNLVICKW